jgi:hypothetical protein
LIYTLETLDGKRGTAKALIEQKKNEFEHTKPVYGRMKSLIEYQMDRLARHQVMRKVFIKYNLQRVRMKISLSALKKLHTIEEHWLR